MSDETAKEESPEEEVAPEAAAPEEASASAESAPEETATESPVAEKAPAEEPVTEASVEEESPAPEVTATQSEEPASEEDSDSEVEEKSEKLKKAEEILRASTPSYEREEMENTFEKVVHINRCAKVVKGGRRFSFSALVVSGDREGKVGFGFGKAQEVSECIKKASESSKRQMVPVNITENTIPHPVIGEHGGGRVLLRPASPGTGLIAGGGVRAVVEAAGIKDVLAKSLGSNNQANVVKATIDALQQLRTKEEIYSLRGKRVADKKAL